MIRLIDTCVKLLAEQDMRKMFIDGVKGGEVGFRSLGKCNDPPRLQTMLMSLNRLSRVGKI